MKPELWGNQFWFTIHTIALNYPTEPSESEQKSVEQFLLSLKDLLPCEKCKKHYQKNLNLTELHQAVTNQTQLFAYTVELHNKVNRMNGKKELSVEEAKDHLRKQYSANDSTNSNSFGMIVMMIIVGVLCWKFGYGRIRSQLV